VEEVYLAIYRVLVPLGSEVANYLVSNLKIFNLLKSKSKYENRQIMRRRKMNFLMPLKAKARIPNNQNQFYKESPMFLNKSLSFFKNS
jgi:hypothetical protein